MKSDEDSEDTYSTNETMATCLLSDTPHYPVSWYQYCTNQGISIGIYEIGKPQHLSLIQTGYEKHVVRRNKDYITMMKK